MLVKSKKICLCPVCGGANNQGWDVMEAVAEYAVFCVALLDQGFAITPTDLWPDFSVI
jgi:hypothetical protein